jgi:ElaB/YqjD/DUF883 family membrane-anchored ribosome-binding protein
MERAQTIGNTVTGNTMTGAQSTRRNGNGSNREQRQQLAAEWNNLVSDVEELIRKVADVGDVEVAKVRERVEKTLAAAKNTAVEGALSLKSYARNASTVTDQYVHERPWTATGIAAAVGLLVGFLVARR